MKICIFSDIHGNIDAFRVFLRDIKRLKCSAFICCGDIFGYYYDAIDVFQELASLNNLFIVRGNHDQNFLDLYVKKDKKNYIEKYGHSYDIQLDRYCSLRNFLLKTDTIREICMDDFKIAIVHGTLIDNLNGRMYPDYQPNETDKISYNKYDLVFQGHTHIKMEKYIGNTLVLNPGSIGQSRNKDGSTYLIVEIKKSLISYEFKKIIWDKKEIFSKIDVFDRNRDDLKKVLEREEL